MSWLPLILVGSIVALIYVFGHKCHRIRVTTYRGCVKKSRG